MATAGVAPAEPALEMDPEQKPGSLFRLAEDRLAELIPRSRPAEPRDLFDAATTALLSRGKRLRPILSMLACAQVGGRARDALDYGCAVETIHAASLVLDDLPCMDDAKLRRGAPALHMSHGEDMAVLAAVALLNQAHRTVLGAVDLSADQRLALLSELTSAVGFEGLTQGQARDLRDAPEARTEVGLRSINHLKTGALIVAAVRGGGIIGGATASQLAALTRFGDCVGFAFQLCDDLQDATSTPQALGKDVAQDRGKLTFVNVWGIGRVRAAIRQAVDGAEEALETAGDGGLGPYVRELLLNASAAR